ncbi:MAG: InlB B-repeat-containing protein [Lachnospiraceae bacterium]|nr:InlB B-repeat-containing protein [Lachnospiraceae bacterium]
MIKRRIARIMAFVLIFLMTTQPFSDVYIYADEDTEEAVSDLKDETEESAGETVEKESAREETTDSLFGISTEVFEDLTEENAGDPIVHTVTFHEKDGSVQETLTDIPDGSTLASVNKVPSSPVVDEDASDHKSRFKGWVKTSNPNDNTIVNFINEKINSNRDFYQYWIPLFSVRFETNCEDTVETQLIEKGKGAVQPGAISKNGGYRFGGWFSDSSLSSGYTFSNSNPVTEDLTIYAGWIKQYTVTFNLNTGDTIKNPDKRVQTVDVGNTVVDPGATKPGNDLIGWYTDESSGDKWNFSNGVSSDMTLYAHWKPQKRTVSFDEYVSSPSIKVQVLNYGEKITKPDDPSKSGCEFVGWYTDPTSGYKWEFDRGIMNDMYLYARFRPVTYNLVFNPGRLSGGVTNMPNNGTVALDSTIVSQNKIPQHDKYKFVNWYSDPECTHIWDFDKPVKKEDVPDGETITLYADWEIKKFNIDFNTNMPGKTVSSQTVEYAEKAVNPEIDKNDYSHIVEWFEEAEFRNLFNFDTEIVKNYNLFAKWTDSKKVSFDTDGGSEIKPTKVVSGTNILRDSIPATIKKGHTFINWYEDLSSDILWDFDTRNKINEDVTLYAKWKVNKYDVNFVNDGKLLRAYSQTINYGERVAKPDIELEKDGHIFTGWYKDEACSTSWNFITDTVSDSDLTLYSGWTVINYSVSYNVIYPDATVSPLSLTVPYNTKLSQPSVSRNGFVLKGWYKDSSFNEKWDFTSDAVTENMTLYAYWMVKKCTVRFDTNGGSTVPDASVNYNSKVAQPKDPSKTGCSFNGWYTNAACTVSFNFKTTLIKDDTTIYAGWITVKPFKVKASVDGSNGKITPSGTVEVQKGGSQAFTFSPAAGYMSDILKVDGVSTEYTNNRFVLDNVQSDHTVTISFKKIPVIRYIISANCDDSFGEIEPRGEVLVTEGKDQTFKFIPIKDYVIDYIYVDGIKTSISGNTYTFENVQKHHTITAYFKKYDPPAPIGYAKVKFIVDGEEIQKEIVSLGQIVKRPADPEKSGLIFMGWYDGNWKWNFSDPVEKDLTLVARFISQTVSKDDVHSGMDKLMDLSDPDNITMVKGQSYDFGKGTWSSSNKQVITVKKSTGVAKAKSPSNVPVTLTNTAVNPNVQYKIKVVAPELSAKKLTMGVGSTTKISVLYSGGLNIAWTSSNPKVASVEEGRITTIAKGKTNINAYLNGMKYTCKVTVSDKYTAPSSFDDVFAFTLRPAQTLDLKKIAVEGIKPNKLDWRLSDESGTKDMDKSGWLAWDDGVVRVNVNGKLKAKSCGTSTLIGKRGDTRVKTIKVTVDTIPSKTETYINVGKNEKLNYFKVNNKKAQWSATNEGTIVLLGSTAKTMGTVYGLNVGSSVVSCSYNGMEYSTKVHVEDPDISTEDSRLGRTGNNEYLLTLKTGTRFVIDLPDVSQHITWKSKDKKIAFVDENGIIEGRKTGKTYVSAKINGTNVKIKVFVTQ